MEGWKMRRATGQRTHPHLRKECGKMRQRAGGDAGVHRGGGDVSGDDFGFAGDGEFDDGGDRVRRGGGQGEQESGG